MNGIDAIVVLDADSRHPREVILELPTTVGLSDVAMAAHRGHHVHVPRPVRRSA